jgi:hypothetical protein
LLGESLTVTGDIRDHLGIALLECDQGASGVENDHNHIGLSCLSQRWSTWMENGFFQSSQPAVGSNRSAIRQIIPGGIQHDRCKKKRQHSTF